ncbi:hypothetical protein TKK_0009828 [Trichogramma kaykai]
MPPTSETQARPTALRTLSTGWAHGGTVLEKEQAQAFELEPGSSDGREDDLLTTTIRALNRSVIAIGSTGAADPLVISVRCHQLKLISAEFLIDTSSDLNLLRISSLRTEIRINRSRIFSLSSISDGVVKTLGRVTISIGNTPCIMDLVPESFPIKWDEILGMKFLLAQRATLSFNYNELILNGVELSRIPSIEYATYFLPARTKTLVSIKISNPDQNTVVTYLK